MSTLSIKYRPGAELLYKQVTEGGDLNKSTFSTTEKYMFCCKNTTSGMLKNNFENGNLLVSSDLT